MRPALGAAKHTETPRTREVILQAARVPLPPGLTLLMESLHLAFTLVIDASNY